MTPLIDFRDRAAVRRELSTLRKWQDGLAAPLKVAMVYGGLSAEDRLYLAESPVEQRSDTALLRSLAAIGADVTVLDPCDAGFVRSLPAFDVALPNLHGPYGEDGRLQGLLDYLRVPVCGSDVAASAVAADKALCKRFMRGLGVPTPSWHTWRPGQKLKWAGATVMVKPALGGSSVGMRLVRQESKLAEALEYAWSCDPSQVLVEEYVYGRSVTVGALQLPGGLLLFPPLATEVADAEFYDAAAKLDAGATGGVTVGPADLPASVEAEVLRHARALWDGLGCRGWARIDFLVTKVGQPYALEVNTTPGMSVGSNFAVGAEACGLRHADAVRAVLREALTRRPYDVPLPTPALGTEDAEDRTREPAV
ncbi:ATP-grasp domain-containing protein [Streptomyces sp. NBC_00669]|uniref:D-alanine--D-alanine ligase family protein n=1 Tax=unclassified Streptomyces TaxID=2593676 RepID=UPI002E2FFA91|nr:ATP-grasp domain-containing protein [Streptomyces sp. NBC_00669]